MKLFHFIYFVCAAFLTIGAFTPLGEPMWVKVIAIIGFWSTLGFVLNDFRKSFK